MQRIVVFNSMNKVYFNYVVCSFIISSFDDEFLSHDV